LLSLFPKAIHSTTTEEERKCIKVYAGIDKGDPLYDTENGKDIFTTEFNNIGVMVDIKAFPFVATVATGTGQVCKVWRGLSLWAWEDGMDFTILLGDDVHLQTCGWMELLLEGFHDIHKEMFPSGCPAVPVGFGVLSLFDVSSPGFPAFPVLYKTHRDIFPNVFPEAFINQDADPFLFQVYLRFNAAKVITAVKVANTIGGCDGELSNVQRTSSARYEKVHVQDWATTHIPAGVWAINSWLRDRSSLTGCPVNPSRPVVMDVVIPSYRVDIDLLSRICSLEVPREMRCTFLVIVDNPNVPQERLAKLISILEGGTNICRVRANEVNRGASYSRNRGVAESCADWVLLLDDDVLPSRNLLIEYCKIIQAQYRREEEEVNSSKWEQSNGAANAVCGYVGNTKFPPATNFLQRAVNLSDLNYMFGISTVIHDPAWGVTANLVIRLTTQEGKRKVPIFGENFPKTGGGEDVDACLRHQAITNGTFLSAPRAIVCHEWWKGSVIEYQR
ncbi:unnamed protein product, partial [Choristocarpus tenellus]